MDLNRREFLSFMGRASAVTLAALPSYSPAQQILKAFGSELPDDLILKPGFKYRTLLEWGTPLSPTLNYGYNNDFISCIPINSKEAFLFVNHETIHPTLMNYRTNNDLTPHAFSQERKEVGFSCFVIEATAQGWALVKDHPLNSRIDAASKIPFSKNTKIAGHAEAIGSLANCAGGKTPWGTFLSCEENYDDFVGEVDDSGNIQHKDRYGWKKHWSPRPEHYGWVVEFDPKSKKTQKHVSLGRFSHEGALVLEQKNNVVVYMGDDKEDECVYKFISKGKSLEEGDLFVANTLRGEWILLNRDKNEILKKNFKTQTELLVQTRKAAKLVGGTPLARPEDIERDPISGKIFVALTSHKNNGAPYGALMSIEEKNGYEGTQFEAKIFLSGGPKHGFACPDNMAFDPKGNLWLTSDISEKNLGQGDFKDFKRNGLYYIPMSGKDAGKVELIAWAPPDAELSGPCFSPDGKLFVAVQHPGSASKNIDQLSSHWPRGGKELPRPSLVEISGKALEFRLA